MIIVFWKYAILTSAGFSGHRVKRRVLSGTAIPASESGVYPSAVGDDPDTWQRIAPPRIHYTDNNDYVFAFWSLRYSGPPLPLFLPISTGRQILMTTPSNVLAFVEATAWYTWDFGGGPGDNGIYVDAFDITAGDFVADDFVNVAPDDPQLTLTKVANEGLVDSDAQIVANNPITISATDLQSASFAYWFEIDSLTAAGSAAEGPPLVGVGAAARDIVAHHSDRLLAFAFYNEVPRTLRIPRYEIYDPWWYFKTHGGLTPGGPPDPFGPLWQGFSAAAAMANVARLVAPELREQALRLVLAQLGIEEAAIKRQIEAIHRS